MQLRPCGALIVVVLLLAVAAPLVTAQYQVNTRVNNTVNRQVYSGSGPTGCINFAGTSGGIQAKSSQMMGSEFKYAAWTSGASRSDLRAGYAALGPHAAGGREAYINYKPAYLKAGTSTGSNSAPPLFNSSAHSAGSMRYPSSTSASAFAQQPSSSSLSTQSIGPRAMSSPNSSSSISSIRYSG